MDITLLTSFGILYRNFISDSDTALKDTNISFSECTFLMNIGAAEGTNQEAIASKLMIDRAAVARSVKLLTAKGYVKVQRSENDHRNKELFLTESGRNMKNYIENYYAERLKALLMGIQPEELQMFLSVLDKLINKVRKQYSDERMSKGYNSLYLE